MRSPGAKHEAAGRSTRKSSYFHLSHVIKSKCFEAKELFKSLNISYNFHSEVLEAASLNIADFENRSKATETADSLKDTDQKILENGANNTSNGEKSIDFTCYCIPEP